MARWTIPPTLEGLLVLLWILIFVGLPLSSLWMKPVEPPDLSEIEP